MDDREQAISNEIRATITRAMTDSERSQHSAAMRLGISDLGSCREKARLVIENRDQGGLRVSLQLPG